VRGYRGFLREFARTGSLRALSLQLRTGALHVGRQFFGRRRGDPVLQFLAYYGPEGVTRPDPDARELTLSATACLVCGLCSLECARVGGAPELDPREAVIAAARLETDWRRLGLSPGESSCTACAACNRVCPAGIPIDRVQARLARLGSAAAGSAASDATGAGIG
jgi:succinate dehydrogenase/fumarate reductase-like Fe-S protein